ncbi:MAG: VOC family protein [bacterium]|nr:VOC family protein [bacterium]
MEYLHTMIRIRNLDESLDFFKKKLGMIEMRRRESERGRFTLVFLAAAGDEKAARANKAPMLELTYNWPDENGQTEEYTGGRNFGHVAYRVENIYETCQSLMDAGVTINRPPRDGHMAFIRSPDGISIELLQKGDDLPPAEPWTSMQNNGSW